MKIEHPSYLFSHWPGYGPRIPYAYIMKCILEYPPKGFEFSEDGGSTPTKDIKDYCEQWFDKAKEFDVTKEEFDKFVDSKQPQIMYQIPKDRKCWLTTIPWYIHPNDWALEGEDIFHFLHPYIGNNHKCLGPIWDDVSARCMKAQFLLPNFKGIVTHIKDTFNSVKGVFGDEVLKKTRFAPLGIPDLGIDGKRKKDNELRIFFHGSTNHTDMHFALRGGMETLEAFKIANSKNSNIKLTILYDEDSMFRLGQEAMNTIKTHPDITYLNRYITKEELRKVLLNVDAVAIPAYRLHSGTCIQALFYGLPILTCDGWGFSEYVMDGFNGLVAKGQTCSWTCDRGILREKYTPWVIQWPLVESLAAKMLELGQDSKFYNKLSKNARKFALENHTIEARDRYLKPIFEEFYGSD